jgi:hypothetical protein
VASYQERISLKLYLRIFRRALRNNCGMAGIMNLRISIATNQDAKGGNRFQGGCQAQVADFAVVGREFFLKVWVSSFAW